MVGFLLSTVDVIGAAVRMIPAVLIHRGENFRGALAESIEVGLVKVVNPPNYQSISVLMD